MGYLEILLVRTCHGSHAAQKHEKVKYILRVRLVTVHTSPYAVMLTEVLHSFMNTFSYFVVYRLSDSRHYKELLAS